MIMTNKTLNLIIKTVRFVLFFFCSLNYYHQLSDFVQYKSIIIVIIIKREKNIYRFHYDFDVIQQFFHLDRCRFEKIKKIVSNRMNEFFRKKNYKAKSKAIWWLMFKYHHHNHSHICKTKIILKLKWQQQQQQQRQINRMLISFLFVFDFSPLPKRCSNRFILNFILECFFAPNFKENKFFHNETLNQKCFDHQIIL